jgi:hypothetical protein
MLERVTSPNYLSLEVDFNSHHVLSIKPDKQYFPALYKEISSSTLPSSSSHMHLP